MKKLCVVEFGGEVCGSFEIAYRLNVFPLKLIVNS